MQDGYALSTDSSNNTDSTVRVRYGTGRWPRARISACGHWSFWTDELVLVVLDAKDSIVLEFTPWTLWLLAKWDSPHVSWGTIIL